MGLMESQATSHYLWFPTRAPIDMNPLGFLKHSNITIPFESLNPSRLQLVRYSSYCCWFWIVLRKTWMHYCILFVNELCGVQPKLHAIHFCYFHSFLVFIVFLLQQSLACFLLTHGLSFASCNTHNN